MRLGATEVKAGLSVYKTSCLSFTMATHNSAFHLAIRPRHPIPAQHIPATSTLHKPINSTPSTTYTYHPSTTCASSLPPPPHILTPSHNPETEAHLREQCREILLQQCHSARPMRKNSPGMEANIAYFANNLEYVDVRNSNLDINSCNSVILPPMSAVNGPMLSSSTKA